MGSCCVPRSGPGWLSARPVITCTEMDGCLPRRASVSSGALYGETPTARCGCMAAARWRCSIHASWSGPKCGPWGASLHQVSIYKKKGGNAWMFNLNIRVQSRRCFPSSGLESLSDRRRLAPGFFLLSLIITLDTGRAAGASRTTLYCVRMRSERCQHLSPISVDNEKGS